MQINRHNYESFFLMYIDNELSATERKAVEAFVALHSDLAEELQQLQALTLSDETVSFTSKSTLLKSELENNMLENLLLLKLDSELSDEESSLLDAHINEDKVQQEWTVLQKTKLDKEDSIVFNNKRLLYKKEEAKVFSLGRIKWAVAAGLLGAGLFFGIKEWQTTGDPDQPGIVQHPTKSIETEVTETDPLQTQLKEENQDRTVFAKDETENKSSESPVEERRLGAADRLKAVPQPDKSYLASMQESKDERAKQNDIVFHTVIPENLNIKPHEDAQIKPEFSLVVNQMDAPDMAPMEGLDKAQQNILAAAFAPDPDADRILYMSQDVLKETKLAKLVKKTKENLSEKTQIKSGRGLRIGNYEIAIR